jgi:ATP-dependent DNA ligase
MLPGFIAPCLPTKAKEPPRGGAWVHEIKHDGFRIIARKEGKRVRLYSRPGDDLTHRFALIVDAVARLRSRSCILDGEAVACGQDGVPRFDRIRYRKHDGSVFLYAFDLIELNGDDLRREPLAVRKATLASVLAKAAPGLRLCEHIEHDDGEVVQDEGPGLRGGAAGGGGGVGRIVTLFQAVLVVECASQPARKRQRKLQCI